MDLRDAPLVERNGTWRTRSLSATWRRFAPHARSFGITRIADLTGLDPLGLPVFSAIRPMGKSLSTQQGKGLTLLAAKVSALMESIETWHAEQHQPTTTASTNQLWNRTIIPPALLAPGTHRAQGNTPIMWSAATAISTVDQVQSPCLVPFDSVTLDCTFGRRKRFADISSNGLASGNSFLEAIVHGTCEVIEREAEANWRNTGGGQQLAIASVVSPHLRKLIAALHGQRLGVWLWQLDAVAGFTVIAAAICDDPTAASARFVGMHQGFGCHISPEIAIARALTEAVQTRVTYVAGARDDFFPSDYKRASDRKLLMSVWRRYQAEPKFRLQQAKLPASKTIGAVFIRVSKLLAAAGIEQLIVADLSLPSPMRVPVVKVIIPGLATDTGAMG